MTTPDAIERLHDLAINKWADGISVNDARAILDHITALTAERDAAVAEVAQIVAWLRSNAMGARWRELADAIAAGAHKETTDGR